MAEATKTRNKVSEEYIQKCIDSKMPATREATREAIKSVDKAISRCNDKIANLSKTQEQLTKLNAKLEELYANMGKVK
jgi:GTP1/Obg family GTP-binding protein